MGYFGAPLRSLRWRYKKCRPFVALMNEDADFVIITALKSLPFCCHADLLVMPLNELVSVARFLNAYLPSALQVDIRPCRTAVQIRNSIEFIVGYSKSSAHAMKVPFSIESITRPRTSSPKTPASPLAMKRSAHEMDISMLGRPKFLPVEEERNSSDTSLNSFSDRRRTPNYPRAATTPVTPKLMQTPRNTVQSWNRPFSSVSSRQSAAIGSAASSHSTPRWLNQSYSSSKRKHSTPVSQGRSPRTPTLQMTEMDLLVSTMMSMSVSRPSVPVSVGEFGVLE